MPRTRDLRPGFFRNEELAELSPLTRLLFAGLWTIADREGRLEDRPKKIKIEVLPYDTCDVDMMLNELAHMGFIKRYVVVGQSFIKITNFSTHQKVHPKEPASLIPDEAVVFNGQTVECNEEEFPNIPLPSFPSLPSLPASTPLPPKTGEVAAELDLKRLLPLRIKRVSTGETVSEDDWLLAELVSELKRSGYRNINYLAGGLAEFMHNNPIAKKLGSHWVKTPVEKRVAALAYAAKQPSVKCELSYALKGIHENWDGIQKLLPQASRMIQADDFLIEVP